MRKKVKYVDVVFENCEVYRLQPENIEVLSIGNIQRSIGINYFQYKDGEIYETIRTEEIELTIKNFSTIEDRSKFGSSNFINRVKNYPDITHLDLIYEDDSNEYITVPWGGDSDYENKYQKTEMSKSWTDEEVFIISIAEEK